MLAISPVMVRMRRQQKPENKSMNTETLQQAATQARGLAIDAVHQAGIGHLGLPLGCAEIGAVLFGDTLHYNPTDPQWLNRDRFVLSAGHGSMFLYAWLHLAGYNLPLEEIINFRQLHSITPGHPEFGETDGVECTTGPLGQGVGNAVGMAVAAKHCAALFNTAEHQIIDHKIICLAGDGCLQEGVAQEAISFAGHNGLDNLVMIYDSNDVTLDAMADVTQSEHVPAKFAALEWNVMEVDGHDMTAFKETYDQAKASSNGKPTIIIAKTEIGRGIPEVAGTSKAHGEGGAKFADDARKGLGLPEEKFFVSDEVKAYFAGHAKQLESKYNDWQKLFQQWQQDNPEKAKLLEQGLNKEWGTADELLAVIPEEGPGKAEATRGSGGTILNALADHQTLIVSGSADLHGSTKNYIKSSGDYNRDEPQNRNFRFGIREHAMGAIVNGIGYYGILNASGATFLAFSDYMRGALRLAALAALRNFEIFTHDSVGVGEDGPTHQPVEQTSALRLIPNLDVIRPADYQETAGAFVHAITRNEGPTALILTRQGLPQLDSIPVATRRAGATKGGYVAHAETGELKLIIISSGSELQHAMAAAEELGAGVRVVSLPCMAAFDRQPEKYREEVLPAACRKRLAIEAGASGLWYKYTGLDGSVLAIDRFGLSAPGATVMQELGMSSDAVVAEAKRLLQE